MRRRLLLTASLTAPLAQSRAQNWPERPVTLIVPFGAGAAPDIMGRQLAEALAGVWGRPVVVQNVPGASATIGVDRVSKAAPDGYTLCLSGDAAIVVRPSMEPPVPYDPLRDLAPVTQLVGTRNLLVATPGLPVTDLAGLIALARARPGELSYGHSGVGFSTHLGMEMFKQALGLDIVAVPYGQESQMFIDLMQGRVHIMLSSGAAMMRRALSGEVRPLAVTSRDRTPSLPQIPTVAEAAVPGFESAAWFGLIAPSGTPLALRGRIHGDVVTAMAQPGLARWVEEFGLVPLLRGPAEFAEVLPGEIARMANVLRPLGLLRPG